MSDLPGCRQCGSSLIYEDRNLLVFPEIARE